MQRSSPTEGADLQEKLIEAQVDYMQKRAEALGKGDALITVQADGLEPQMESIWVEIIRKIQVRASEERLEMLIGTMGREFDNRFAAASRPGSTATHSGSMLGLCFRVDTFQFTKDCFDSVYIFRFQYFQILVFAKI